MTINIGSSVFWNETDGPGAGMWSGVVKSRFLSHGVEQAGIYCDGIIVPTMMRCGIQGPNSWTPEVYRPLDLLKLRPEANGDDSLREAWEAKKVAYYAAEEELVVARFKALKARYNFVEPGMGVSQSDGQRVYTGVVVSVDLEDLFVLVEGSWFGEPITQINAAIDTLVYH